MNYTCIVSDLSGSFRKFNQYFILLTDNFENYKSLPLTCMNLYTFFEHVWFFLYKLHRS